MKRLVLLLLLGIATTSTAVKVNWCVTSYDELTYCNNMASDLLNTYTSVGLEIECVQETNKYACMRLVKDKDQMIWLVGLSPEDAFIAARFHQLQPLVEEVYTLGARDYAVAVIKSPEAGGTIQKISDLRQKKSCHPDIDNIAGWHVPYARLVSQMTGIADCDASLNNTAAFFSESCAPGSWALDAEYKKALPNLCALCKESCGRRDPYALLQGAVDCLKSAGADAVAFTTYSAARKALTTELNSYALLCTRPNPLQNNKEWQPIGSPQECNWASIPGHLIMLRGSVPDVDKNDVAGRLARIYDVMPTGGKPSWFTNFFLSESPDETNQVIRINIIPILERVNYKLWLDEGFRWAMHLDEVSNQGGTCGGPTFVAEDATMCVISTPEFQKCEEMRDAMMSKRIRPFLKCQEGSDYKACVQQVSRGGMDMVNLNAGYIYYAGTTNDITNKLKPLAQERFKNEPREGYYSVAVMKSEFVRANNLNIFRLRNRGFKSCHAYEFEGASWIVMSQRLMDLKQLFVYNCDVSNGLRLYMNGGSCVPGATREQASLCKQCSSGTTSSQRCKISQEDPYFNHVGAFRCLAEGAGDIAFTRHTVPTYYTSHDNDLDDWARDLSGGNYVLLCADGNNLPIDSGSQCNLNFVPSNHIMVSERLSSSKASKFWRMLDAAQRFFGSRDFLATTDGPRYEDAAFHMFQSKWYTEDILNQNRNFSDLIFTDSTFKFEAMPSNSSYRDVVNSITGQWNFYTMAKQSDYNKPSCWRRNNSALSLSSTSLPILTLITLLYLVRRVSC